jgi:hypothetical protein
MRVVIDPRFRGPPSSGNGGYSCGLLGKLVDGAAEVTLRRPPPLDRPLDTVEVDGGLELRDGGTVIAEARPASLDDLEIPVSPTLEEATEATRGYRWFTAHPFPMCFVCGPDRTEGDGLRIFPGDVPRLRVSAAPWVPDASVVEDGRVRPEVVWAALDCPSWFGMLDREPDWKGGGVLLGRLAARVNERPRAGEPCIVMGWHIGTDRRKVQCGSALLGEEGRLVAAARATWITFEGAAPL